MVPKAQGRVALHKCTLYKCTTAQVHKCTSAQVHNCTTEQVHTVCRFAEEKQKNQMDIDGKYNLHWICGYGGHMTTYGAVGQARERGRGKPKSKNSCLLFCRSKLSLATDIRQKSL